jgi:hypothetical protein
VCPTFWTVYNQHIHTNLSCADDRLYSLMSCPNDANPPHEYTVQRQNQSSHGARVGPRPQPQAAAKPASDSVCKRVESSQMWLVSVD